LSEKNQVWAVISQPLRYSLNLFSGRRDETSNKN